MLQRLRLHLRDTRDLFILPFLAATLPRHHVHGWLKRYTLRSGAYIEETKANAAGRCRIAFSPDAPVTFADDYRFLRMLANAEMFRVALGRPTLTIPPDVTIPMSDQVGTLALSTHWGSALGLLKDFAQRAGPVHFVIAPGDPNERSGRPVRYAFARLSIRIIERLTQARCIVTGAAREEIGAALQRREHVCILFDVPTHLVGRSEEAPAQGISFLLPTGFAQIAYQLKTPVFFFAALPPTASPAVSAQVLVETPSSPCEGVETLLAQCAAFLNTCLRFNQAAWHMWQHGNELFASQHHRSPETGNDVSKWFAP